MSDIRYSALIDGLAFGLLNQSETLPWDTEWLYKVEKITENFKKRTLFKYLEDGGAESAGRICQFILVIFLLKTQLEL